MVQIVESRVIADSTPHEWRDERTFESADGAWRLHFHDPNEWHMGADGWQVKLTYHDKDVSAGHQLFKTIRIGRGFNLPAKYQPWCQDKPVVALHPWNSTIYLYGVDDHRSIQRQLSSFPLEIQWAPRGELLGITCEGQVQLLNKNAECFASISILHPRNENPEAFWWPDGRQLFLVSRESRTVKTRLSFFDSSGGELLSSTEFDPLDLLPYDEASYAKIDRDRYTLDVGSGIRSVGYLLDKWSRLEFDSERCLLRGTVYRPEGPCEEKRGEYTCTARERSIEVALRA